MKKEQLSSSVWSARVAVDDVPETGRRIELVPDDATRAAIAKVAGLEALPWMRAEYDLTRQGVGGLRVEGRITATVRQNCVVTLDPIENEIDEAVDLVFQPQREPAAVRAERIHVDVPVDAEETTETLQDGAVDLGAIAVEFLLLGIDPYPRKPGAVFDSPAPEEPGDHPFAALVALKRDRGSDTQ